MKNTDSESVFADADLVYSYTRAQALEDGLLVDLTEQARETGFRVPVAITRAAWADCIEWPREREREYQDEPARARDVLWMLRCAISARRANSTELLFWLVRIPRGASRATKVQLKCVSGPGDNAEHVMTIMLPEED